MKIFIAMETIPSQAAHLRQQIANDFSDIALPDTEKFLLQHKTLNEGGEKPKTFLELKNAAMIKYYQHCQKREALIDAAWRQTAYDGSQGEIICLSWAIEQYEPNSVSRSAGFNEAELLDSFFTILKHQREKEEITWIGYDVMSILQFLFQRAVILRVKPPLSLGRDLTDSWEEIDDVMVRWMGFKNKIHFNHLCHALGIPLGEAYIDSSLIWDFVKLGQIQHVANHCKNQVIRCREVYQRLCFINHTSSDTRDTILCNRD